MKIFHFAILKTLNINPQDYYSEYSSEQYDGHPMYDDDIGGGVPPELIGPLMEVMIHPHNMMCM